MKAVWPWAPAAIAFAAILAATYLVERRRARKPRATCWWCDGRDGTHTRGCSVDATRRR